MIAVKQSIQDLRMPFRNNKKSCAEINAFTVFYVCSSNYKKILLINPFDSPFYELSKLLIFAPSPIFFHRFPYNFTPVGKGDVNESLPSVFPVSRLVTWSDMTLHSLEPRLYPAKIGKWRPQEEPNMAYFETTSFFPTKDVVDVICRILLIRQLWFSFRWRVFFIHGKY